ncbi:MAG TPA: hypothetical protein PLU87_09675 [Sedimentisphaerales bacterium]|nr:hypothetical protein [Sedimentisphaerales bacterium]HRS11388.1 hypothetical protein [Sedimentisphaerales bacterium]HRV47960.1 hypothetical protein [Sedimentisphaerales bacterium]
MSAKATFLAGVWVLSMIGAAASVAAPSVIVVVGAPGMPEYREQFTAWTGLWERACTRAGAPCRTVGLNDSAEMPDRLRLKELLATEPHTGDAPLWLVLIGHGTFDGRTARFNLRGPDLTADDLVEWLRPMQRTLALIDVSSSSAPFLPALSAPGRVIVTATKSGFEQNYTRFGRYLAEAIAEPQADLDKDGQTSLLEAFLTASDHTQAFYQAQGRLATEHALLDDNGDGLGTPADWFRGIRPVRKAADGASLDGYRAHQLHLLYSDTESAMPPALRAERDRLELEVMKRRDAKAELPEAQYYSQLEVLLCEIARIYEQIDPK